MCWETIHGATLYLTSAPRSISATLIINYFMAVTLNYDCHKGARRVLKDTFVIKKYLTKSIKNFTLIHCCSTYIQFAINRKNAKTVGRIKASKVNPFLCRYFSRVLNESCSRKSVCLFRFVWSICLLRSRSVTFSCVICDRVTWKSRLSSARFTSRSTPNTPY